METQETRRNGRRNGTAHGSLRAAVLVAIRNEDLANPLTDLAVAAGVGVSESAISQARRALFLPPARKRADGYKKGIRGGAGIARCQQCMRAYEVPPGKGSTECPLGHGRLTLSSYRLVVPD